MFLRATDQYATRRWVVSTLGLLLAGIVSGCAASTASFHDIALDTRFDPTMLATAGVGVGAVVSILDPQEGLQSGALAASMLDKLRSDGGYPEATGVDDLRAAVGAAVYARLADDFERDGFVNQEGLSALAAAVALPRYLIFVRLDSTEVDEGREDECRYAERVIAGSFSILDRQSGVDVWSARISDSKRNKHCDLDGGGGLLADFVTDVITGGFLGPAPPPAVTVADDLLRGIAIVLPKPPDGSSPVTKAEYVVVEPDFGSIAAGAIPLRASWEIVPETAGYAYRETSDSAAPLFGSAPGAVLVAVGVTVSNYADAYFGKAFESGDDLVVTVRLARFAITRPGPEVGLLASITDPIGVDIGLSFEARRNGDVWLEATYERQATAWTLSAAMDDAVSEVFTRFLADVGARSVAAPGDGSPE